MDPTGQYKLVEAPGAGLCDWEPASYLPGAGPFLFDLFADPTETHPLTDDAPRLAAMVAAAAAWQASIAVSQVNESQCMPPASAPMHIVRNGSCLAGTQVKHALPGSGAWVPALHGAQLTPVLL